MKTNYLFLSITIPFILFVLVGCNEQPIPKKMPADFKIELNFDGGMINKNRSITLQLGECVDEGRDNDGDFESKFIITDTTELETLYQELKKLNAFTLKSKNVGHVDDRGGESIRYTLNKKYYTVSNSQSHFILKKDIASFNSSINLIVTFSDLHAVPEMVKSSGNIEYNYSEGVIVEQTDTSMVVIDNNVKSSIKTGNDDLNQPAEMEEDYNTGIPPKMPNDFKIKYEMNGGISGDYRTVVLQFGSCTDEGKIQGEANKKFSWINKSLKDFENLYSELYKLNAFSLKYTTKDGAIDRGGEGIKFTINKKEYIASDKDNFYLKAGDKPNFKKVIVLILAYADKNHGK